MPIRFIHTADWQLGLRVNYIPGDAGAEVRNARLRAVRRIGEIARDRDAAFVVVAGDVFEHHGLRPATVRQTFDALSAYPVPVYLLPGNHDPYTPDSLFSGDLWKRECPDNVHVLASTTPVDVADGTILLPCPLLNRAALEDPTHHLTPDFGAPDAIRVAVAHGSVREFLERLNDSEHEAGAAISMDASARGALDYLALGDWHGLLQVNDHTWYSGTPEATRFKEKNPGHVLCVEIAEHGSAPSVTPIAVRGLCWTQLAAEVNDDADLGALARRVDAIADKADTLLELSLTGTLTIEQRDRLEREVLSRAGDRFRWFRVRDEALHTYIRNDDLAAIGGDGWVGDVVRALANDHNETPKRALQLLYRIHQEVSQ